MLLNVRFLQVHDFIKTSICLYISSVGSKYQFCDFVILYYHYSHFVNPISRKMQNVKNGKNEGYIVCS